MSYRIMILVEDLDYVPISDGGDNPDAEPRPDHPADAGWFPWNGHSPGGPPITFENYEDALDTAERMSQGQIEP